MSDIDFMDIFQLWLLKFPIIDTAILSDGSVEVWFELGIWNRGFI